MGAIHGRGYYDRFGLGEACFSGARRRCGWGDSSSQAAAAQPVLAFFSRLPSCLVGLEACATAHYWARELGALGHEVRLMPAQYVKAYVKRNKNDAADAAAICEAVRRPTMRFVPATMPTLCPVCPRPKFKLIDWPGKSTVERAAGVIQRRILHEISMRG